MREDDDLLALRQISERIGVNYSTLRSWVERHWVDCSKASKRYGRLVLYRWPQREPWLKKRLSWDLYAELEQLRADYRQGRVSCAPIQPHA